MKKDDGIWIWIMRGIVKVLCPGYHLAQDPPKGNGRKQKKAEETAPLFTGL